MCYGGAFIMIGCGGCVIFEVKTAKNYIKRLICVIFERKKTKSYTKAARGDTCGLHMRGGAINQLRRTPAPALLAVAAAG